MIQLFYNPPNSTTTTPQKIGEGEICDSMIHLDPSTLNPYILIHTYQKSFEEFVPIILRKLEKPEFSSLEIDWMVGQAKNCMLGAFMIWKKSLIKLEGQNSFFDPTTQSVPQQQVHPPQQQVPAPQKHTEKEVSAIIAHAVDSLGTKFMSANETTQNKVISLLHGVSDVFSSAHEFESVGIVEAISKKISEFELEKSRKKTKLSVGLNFFFSFNLQAQNNNLIY